MTNAQIATAFDTIADLLEFQGANPFRLRAYRNGARTIRDLSESVATLVKGNADLTTIPGIGNDLAAKCVVFVEHGKLPLLEELLAQVPPSVLTLLRIPGLGPKKAAVLHRELQIETLDELKEACLAKRVRDLKGFGAKTEQAILDGIPFATTAGDRIYWAQADRLATELRDHLRGCAAIEQIELAGSYRRGKETVGDIDILVSSQDATAVMDHFATCGRVSEVLLRGDTKMSVRVDGGLQVDLRVVPRASFGAALQYFTGSKEHNVVVRGLAKQRGLRVNEYGVYDAKTEALVAGATEEEVYAAVGLPCFPPELRENRQEFVWAEHGNLPVLVTLDDIRGDLHMHTSATDGKSSLREMIDAAAARGLDYIAITDHSQRVSMANGLNPQRLRKQWADIDQINKQGEYDLLVLKGIECDILEDGEMDLPRDVLAEADWVLASIHYGQKQPRAQITARLLGALEHPYVSAIAHPTGRILNKREAYDVDLEAVFAAAKQHGKLLELNANPARLDLNDIYCAAARQHGIPIVISTDAHSTEGLNVMRYGVLQARRAGLTADDVANTRRWPQLKQLIGQHDTPTDPAS